MHDDKKIPQRVLEDFDLQDVSDVTKIGLGMINQTFCVTQVHGEKWVVQSLSSIFDASVTDDAAAVVQFLQRKGWPCPTFKKTIDGDFYAVADEKVWRVMRYVEHTSFDDSDITRTLYENIGALLGRLHADLVHCDYTPQFHIEGFHDQKYYLDKAAQLDWSTCNPETQDMAQEVQKLLSQGTSLFTKCRQLIHGDPRIENIFFHRGNTPFLFIDYDTFMEHSIYVDIGDCLRSLTGLKKNTVQEVVVAFVAGYNTTSRNTITADEVTEALQTIALELTLRFLNDIVEDYYFDWDREKFTSRKESNLHHAKKLWHVYKKTKG